MSVFSGVHYLKTVCLKNVLQRKLLIYQLQKLIKILISDEADLYFKVALFSLSFPL